MPVPITKRARCKLFKSIVDDNTIVTYTVRFSKIILYIQRDTAEKHDKRSAFLVAVASQKRV